MTTTMITGYPGFIAERLVHRLAARDDELEFQLLAESRFVERAREAATASEAVVPSLAGRWIVVAGDIRQPDLGLEPKAADRARARVTTLWHLAAVYDLATPEPIARGVNVDGTAQVLDFCETLPQLERLFYISTIVVAGDRRGRVFEAELAAGQRFRNHYESTKHDAERLVRERLDAVPTVILRPAVVVGDSKTGETAKGDGPYFVARLASRLPAWLPTALPGPVEARMNIVPVDYLVDAMAHIAGAEGVVGDTFHVADPDPVPTREWITQTLLHLDRRAPWGTLPPGLVKRVLSAPVLGDWFATPAESIDYLNQPVTFDVTNTLRALDGAVRCPNMLDYWPRLVDWALVHPHVFGH